MSAYCSQLLFAFVFVGASYWPLNTAASVLTSDHWPRTTDHCLTTDQQKPRHVFVLHDGFHTILSYPNPSWATEDMKSCLIKLGVEERDIVVMPCPFPKATLKDMFPKAGFEYFLNCFDPASRSAHQSYVDLDRGLKKHGVRAGDKLVWIGHSAGGQIGLTVAHLGGSLARYPDLARLTAPHRFDMVVTLGSPLGLSGDHVMPGVKRRHYYSPTDRVVHLAWVLGNLGLPLLGYQHRRIELVPVPSPLHADTVVRVFYDIEHPQWPKDEEVLTRILFEFRQDYQPSWRRGAVSPGMGASLAGLMCRALEEQGQVSVEDPFANK